ncbi:MAG: PQQ-dependent sugar dehydrogenase, partial [Ignavibacteriota bacterium]
MKTVLAFFLVIIFTGLCNGQYSLQLLNDSLLSTPLAMETPDDGSGKIYVAELAGKIKVFKNASSFNSGKTFLNITDRVFPGGNGLGLLGFAFHPNFKDNKYIYLNYIGFVNYRVSTIISRFTVSASDPDSAIAGSEVILLTITQPGWAHKGGSIEFGPDGYLYIPMGDGSDGYDPDNNAQNMQSLLGKISRIDVDIDVQNAPPYGIPSDNPFAEDTTGIRREIYASGFRNPWQSSFDSYSGAYWVGDVGQDRYEEIDTVVKGGNYGWRIMEGYHRNADPDADTTKLIPPLWEYDHWDAAAGPCVVGGFVYHGLLYPKLRNKYIYADFGTARIWALTYDNGTISNELLVDHDTSHTNISCLSTDKVGNIYVVSVFDGKIYKLNPVTESVQGIAPLAVRLERNVIESASGEAVLIAS